jgi:hypothetical protein
LLGVRALEWYGEKQEFLMSTQNKDQKPVEQTPDPTQPAPKPKQRTLLDRAREFERNRTFFGDSPGTIHSSIHGFVDTDLRENRWLKEG